ncbi:acidic mammalian chitinase-like [Gigantopelta aegis]|uniref:acidic mammalian chitinase-like n=1 Tax=Gigantopelta aegis TaxID=1735272 RepID=UPI001B889EDA|nr:acidic mammalian chitinase-like [Gigantopelta aegis]
MSEFMFLSSKYYRRVCYFANWARWRRGIGKHTPADVDPFLCTHIIFAFAKFRSDGRILPQEPGPDEQEYGYRALANLKQQNRNLRLLLAFGGWNFGSRKFSNMAASSRARARFVHSAVLFLRKYGFDGLDIDWEYPAIRGGRSADKQNLVVLCRELIAAFASDAARGGSERLLLIAAVPASPQKASIGYDVPALSKYLDFINLMTYNFHGSWERKTGFNSPLYSSVSDANRILNMDAAARWWHKAGMPKNKITIGMATYGRTFTLSNQRDNGVGASAFNGPAGLVTRQKGFWSYYEICQEIQRGGGRVVLDNIQKVPYYVKGPLWISYDNEWSLRIKVNDATSKAHLIKCNKACNI